MKLHLPSNCSAKQGQEFKTLNFKALQGVLVPPIRLKYLGISGMSGLFLNRLDVLMKGLLFWLSFCLSVNCFLGTGFCDEPPSSLLSGSVAPFLKVFVDNLRLRFTGGFPCGDWSFLFRAPDCFRVNKQTRVSSDWELTHKHQPTSRALLLESPTPRLKKSKLVSAATQLPLQQIHRA